MTKSNVRDLLDEATQDMPPGLWQPPLASIHDRARRRRRAQRVTVAATVLAVAMAVTLSALKKPPRLQQPLDPAPTASAISWQFAFLFGDELHVYATNLARCTVVEDAVVEHETKDSGRRDMRGNPVDGPITYVSVTGKARRGDDCSRVGFPSWTIKPAAAPNFLVDLSSYQGRPLYDRADLPRKTADNDRSDFGYGVIAIDDGQPFFQAQIGASNTPIFVRGLGLLPQSMLAGEPLRMGSTDGIIVIAEGGYRYRWLSGFGEVGYELYTPDDIHNKDQLIALLNTLFWP